MANPLFFFPINPRTRNPSFPPSISPIPSQFCFVMASSAEPQSALKPLNPNADPFLFPPPLLAPTPPAPLHATSFMSGFGNLYYFPRPASYWQLNPYPAISCYDATSLWPYQVGFADGALQDADMEYYTAFGCRNSCKLKRNFGVSTRPPRKVKFSRWVQKKEFVNEKVKINSSSSNCSGITTLMIKNIPNQFMRQDLLRMLDRYCEGANNQNGDSQTDFCSSEYDFLYLPMDFRRSWFDKKVSNLGYAFVNFTTAAAASRFCSVYHNYKWEVNVNKKICEITAAKIQGREALKNAFRNKIFWCDNEQYLPVCLSPASDGCRRYKAMVVGKRVHRLPRKPLKKVCG